LGSNLARSSWLKPDLLPLPSERSTSLDRESQ
jgi:hypothetical protein